MSPASRVLTIAEMQARDLARRRSAVLLLIALPLAFYGAMAGHESDAVIPGGIAMAFSLAGAAIFSVLSSRAVDQRLALAGYRPAELLAGRLLFLEALSVPVVAGSAALMATVSDPPRPWILGLAVAMVALVAVPFGLAVGSLVPRDLEATLILIGVVGIQLSLDPSAVLSKMLPFYGPRRLIDISLGTTYSLWQMTMASVAYSAALLVAALVLMARRVRVRRLSSSTRSAPSSVGPLSGSRPR
jgi:hypothetical protein